MLKLTEKQLISKLRELKQIKPSENWVVSVQSKIFEDKHFQPISLVQDKPRVSLFPYFSSVFFQHKLSFASVLAAIILVGLFGFTQNSLPGDILYPLKKITEQSQSIFITSKAETGYNLQMASRRLDDLTKVAHSNSAKNLGSAIDEFQASVSKAVESLAKNKDNKKDLTEVKEIAFEIKEIEQKTEKIKSMGVEIEQSEKLASALANVVEAEIKDLETKTLSEEQAGLLNQAKEAYQNNNYSEALEKIFEINK